MNLLRSHAILKGKLESDSKHFVEPVQRIKIHLNFRLYGKFCQNVSCHYCFDQNIYMQSHKYCSSMHPVTFRWQSKLPYDYAPSCHGCPWYQNRSEIPLPKSKLPLTYPILKMTPQKSVPRVTTLLWTLCPLDHHLQVKLELAYLCAKSRSLNLFLYCLDMDRDSACSRGMKTSRLASVSAIAKLDLATCCNSNYYRSPH